MNAQETRQYLQNGFRLFIVHLTDRRHFTVPHPDFIVIGKDVGASIGEDDVPRTIDLLPIVLLQEAASH